MKTEIIPHVGFGKVKLGQTLGQIEKLLGKPNENKRNYYREDNSNEVVLKYHHIGADLVFSSDNSFRLSSITLFSRAFTLNGKSLIGSNQSELILKFKNLFEDLKLDDDFEELNAKDYSIDSIGISFWLDNGIIESITLFPKYQNDNETIIWPK
ncbi:hypothetical protein [Pontimicrobium aquaticum]|uniref:Uncharacterized protein n=1 Tax=Pontimicrobium aquaticum TaxID=2565367 RepID=A0A4U0F0T6_9FLAO|nr:hypothetical protein [Pontimicrobium aquaticum]TJY38031.1 hypothetical protein E5167_01880 [Pontimicrobium aquaticum]